MSQPAAAPTSSGMNRKSVTPPTAYPVNTSRLTTTAASGASFLGSTAYRTTAPSAQAATSVQTAAWVVTPEREQRQVLLEGQRRVGQLR